jgi:hypothetical protein
MSYVEIFVIEANGDVVSYSEVRNNHACAPMIWQDLANRHSFSASSYVLGDAEGLEALWSSIGSGELTRWEELVLVCTFDFIWVPRELVRESAEAFRRWFRRISKDKPNLVSTAAGVGRQLLEILDKCPDCLGVAFNMCSANESFWSVYADEGRMEASRAYNILTDGEQLWGEYAGKRAESIAQILEGPDAQA